MSGLIPKISDGKKRVVVAMSGGVDSSVAAAMLAREGHEVIGITLRLWTPSPSAREGRPGSCCSPSDVADAKRVSQQLGIAHYTFDMEKKFRQTVVDNFISEYLDGRTPNPCVRCNSFIKFDALMNYAVAMDADYLATGHYARIARAGGEYYLHKAVDWTKDQSYFLYMLNQPQLSRLLFPLGGLTKAQVREVAAEFKLANSCKPDSQDVCFLEGRGYREFLNEQTDPVRFVKGPIKTKDGKVVGQHDGLPFYTIGQRGNGVALGHRAYVIEKEAETNTLVIGAEEDNLSPACITEAACWAADAPAQPVRAQVKVRYRHPGAPATLHPEPSGAVRIQFDQPQASVTPGQSAVFYDGERVLGGAVIASGQ